ncbi:hypothetical protein A4V01_09905 [Erysipelotrichaceae bacterium I46]|nr:hypothetical protein A4V01_09905 [Erysipelotrichaceae bacterium I46]
MLLNTTSILYYVCIRNLHTDRESIQRYADSFIFVNLHTSAYRMCEWLWHTGRGLLQIKNRSFSGLLSVTAPAAD